jgi:hypothetical protein
MTGSHIRSRSSRPTPPWPRQEHAEVAFNAYAPATEATLPRRSRCGRLSVLRQGPAAAWESLAICANVADQPLQPGDNASHLPVAAMPSPTMATWTAATEAEPWILRDDADAGSA